MSMHRRLVLVKWGIVQFTYVRKDGTLGDYVITQNPLTWATFYAEINPNDIPDVNVDKNIPVMLVVGMVNESTGVLTYTINNILLINNEYGVYPTIKENLDLTLKSLDVAAKGSTEGLSMMLLGDSLTAALGDTSWHYYAQKLLNISNITNVAMGGATLRDRADTGAYDGNPTIDNPSQNVIGNQIQKIINNAYSAPDIIVVGIGLNDIFEFSDETFDFTYEEIASVYYDSSFEKIPLTSANRKTTLGAFRYVHEKLHELYPNAVIVFNSESSTSQKDRDPVKVVKYADSLEKITKFVSLPFIDAKRCGINWINEYEWGSPSQPGEYLYDGLHHNQKGAKLYGAYIASELRLIINQVKLLKGLI